MEEDHNFQFISLSLSEIVNKCQLQGMMKSYGPQEDEIQNKLGESGEHLSAFDHNLATLTQAWQDKSMADKEKLRAQYELEKQS